MAAEAGVAVGAVGLLLRFMVGAVAGMAAGTMVAWLTWVMGGVVMHRARTAGLTRIQHLPVTLLIISVTITQISVTITQ